MTKAEIATYLGMANIMLSSALANSDDEIDDMMIKMREALMAAQLLLTEQAIQEAVNHDKRPE